MLSREAQKWISTTENGDAFEVSPSVAHSAIADSLLEIVEKTNERSNTLDIECSKKAEELYALANGWYDNEDFIDNKAIDCLVPILRAISADYRGPKTCEVIARYAVREAWYAICELNDVQMLWELFKFYRDDIFLLTLRANDKECAQYDGIVRAFYAVTEYGELQSKVGKLNNQIRFDLFDIPRILAQKAAKYYKKPGLISEEQVKEYELVIENYEIISILACASLEEAKKIYRTDYIKKVYERCLSQNWYAACFAMDTYAGLDENRDKLARQLGDYRVSNIKQGMGNGTISSDFDNSGKPNSGDALLKAKKTYYQELEKARMTELLFAKNYIRLRQKGLREYIDMAWPGISNWTVTGKSDALTGNVQLTLRYPQKSKVCEYIHLSWDELEKSYSHYKLDPDSNPYLGKFYKYFVDVDDADFDIPDISGIKDLYLTNEEFYNYNVNTGRFEDLLNCLSDFDLKKLSQEIEYRVQSGITIVDKEYDKYIYKLKALLDWFSDISKEYKLDKASIGKGEEGEQFIVSELAKYHEGDWSIFNGAILPITSPRTDTDRRIGEFENDLLVVNENGVFTLEIKNYQKGKLEIYSDGRVAHYNSRGELLPSEKQNMIEQSENHIRYLTIFLKDMLDDPSIDVKNLVHGIIVIANNDFEISKNELEYPIVRPVLLGKTLSSSYGEKLSPEMQNKLVEIIKANLKGAHKYPHKDYNAILSLFTDNQLRSIYNACKALKIQLKQCTVNYRG